MLYAVTDPDAKDPYRRTSIFLVPTDTPGVEIIRNVGVGGGGEIGGGNEGYVRYNDVRLPYDALLGERGAAFVIAQVRLGGGRVHHAMRTVGACKNALDLMCQRAVSRTTRDGKLADLQMVQADIADSWIQLESFRLMVLRTAWLIDKHQDYQLVRKDIAAIKVMMPKVYNDIATKAAHLHGALGVSNEMPFMHMVTVIAGHGHRRRPHRGAQGHAGQAGPQGLPPRQRPLPRLPHPQAARGGPGEVRQGAGRDEGRLRRAQGQGAGLRRRRAASCGDRCGLIPHDGVVADDGDLRRALDRLGHRVSSILLGHVARAAVFSTGRRGLGQPEVGSCRRKRWRGRWFPGRG